MTGERRVRALLALIVLAACLPTALGGDALYGRVVGVKSAKVLTLAYGAAQYDVQLNGIDVPDEFASKAKDFLHKLARGKNASVRIDGRTPSGELMGRVFIQDPGTRKMQDAGWELVNAGLARRQGEAQSRQGADTDAHP